VYEPDKHDCFTEDGIGFDSEYGERRERFLLLGQ